MSGHAYQCVLAAPPIVDTLCVSIPRIPLDAWRTSPDLEDHCDESLLVRREPIGGGIQVAICVPGTYDCTCEAVAHEVTSHPIAQNVLCPELSGSHELSIRVDPCEGVPDRHCFTFQ